MNTSGYVDRDSWRDAQQRRKFLAWDFGSNTTDGSVNININAVSIRSVKVKQFDTNYGAKTLAVQFSDDGHCFYDASWFINATANGPLSTSSVGGHVGVTTSPPSVEPTSSDHPSGHGGDASLNLTFTLGGLVSAIAAAGVHTLWTVVMAKVKQVTSEGTSAADGTGEGAGGGV